MFLIGLYFTFFLFSLQLSDVKGDPLLLLFCQPLILFGLDPVGKKFLRLGVSLDEDGVFVKFKIVHCLKTGKH